MKDDGGKPRDGVPMPKVGEWLVHHGPIKLHISGLHASRKIIDALRYAQYGHKPWCALVEAKDDIQESSNRLVCRRRKIIHLANVNRTLHEFAVYCAVMAMEKAGVSDERSWQAVDIKLAWLEGVASDEDLAAARYDAGVAWDDAARVAGRAITGSAVATRNAMQAATWAAISKKLAPWAAVRNADLAAAAWASARNLVRDARGTVIATAMGIMDKLLTSMVCAEMEKL
jgi:hypothetical protein